jgi:FkbM family methyltransferase
LTPLIGATEDNVPVIDPALFAPTIDQMLHYHVKAGQVHDADFYFFKDAAHTSVFCDVGANLGLSVLSMAATGARPLIHSFEINPALFPKLKDVAAGYPCQWQLHEFGLAEFEGEVWIYVVRADDIYILGEATLRLDFLQEPASIERLLSYAPNKQLHVFKMRASVRRFDDLGIRPDYMKIDAEGAEATVVRGMRTALAASHPVVMIENGAMIAVDHEMFALGFKAFHYSLSEHLLRPRPQIAGQNSFYVHHDRIAQLEAQGRLSRA